jgi:hypothetical protein
MSNQGIRTNKQETKDLAKQAGEWAHDLATRIDEAKRRGLDVSGLEADVKDVHGCAAFSCLCVLESNHILGISVLEKIAKLYEKRVKQRFSATLTKQSDADTLKQLRSELNQAHKRFMVRAHGYGLIRMIKLVS